MHQSMYFQLQRDVAVEILLVGLSATALRLVSPAGLYPGALLNAVGGFPPTAMMSFKQHCWLSADIETNSPLFLFRTI